jgi:hypothetical protein
LRDTGALTRADRFDLPCIHSAVLFGLMSYLSAQILRGSNPAEIHFLSTDHLSADHQLEDGAGSANNTARPCRRGDRNDLLRRKSPEMAHRVISRARTIRSLSERSGH